uniref:Uncharacterized protein n=1 Tax=Cucumis sativus TaxID=3659 RepID=A0A0A0KD25_CUCSA
MALLYQLQVCILLHFLFLISVLVNSHHLCHPKESSALLEFKNTFWKQDLGDEFVGQPSYRPYSTWNDSTDCCLWDGVECEDDEGEGSHVVGLHLGCSSLQGTLHANTTLFTLSQLKTLNLSYNNFSGSPFSPQFGILTNLRVLDLSYSSFQGHVPLQISHLSKLVFLDLSYNYDLSFSNVVMNQLVHNLTNLRDFGLAETNLLDITPISNFMNLSLSLASLDLSSSYLSGNFPNHILGLPNLKVLRLDDNPDLNGHLSMSSWSKSLEILDLSRTNFSGEIPSYIGEAKALRYLDLSFCNFNGEIPESIENLTQPPNLQIHSNSSHCFLNLNQQVSSNPFQNNVCLHTLSNIIHLDLRNNSFIGGIPSWPYSSPSLKYLDLSNNQFFGFVRNFRSNSLEYLDLSNNKLQGEISESIYKQLNFTYLDLGSNNLSGVLNLDMLRIPSLSSLDISNNPQLSIFSTTVTPANLLFIRMDGIKLEKFPFFLQNQNNLSYLDLSNNQIVGKIPEWFSELGGLSVLLLSHNFLSSGIEVIHTMPKLMMVYLDFNLFNKLPVPMLLPSVTTYFSVSNNEVSGNVHPSICQATNLNYLDLSHNSLSSELPSCLSNMTNLDTLILKSNDFSGVIPIPPRIRNYIASENQFDGEIPHSICLALNLQILSFSNNRMRGGTIPSCLTNITSLSVLDLKGNNFVGMIPTFFPTGCQLSSLNLNDNQLKGELPQSLLNCENLQVLDLGSNKITGHFPYWLKAASNLRVLILRSNRFYGNINNSFNKDSFSNLRIIDLSHNSFIGPLPSNFFKNMRAIMQVENKKYSSYDENEVGDYYQDSIVISLKGLDQKLERILLIWKTIDLSCNNFNGEIPKEIGMLRSLVGLNLSHNKLKGGIPTSLGNLNNLEWLDLSTNQLVGRIPPQLIGLTFLSYLNLSQNQLSGPIPQGKQFGTFRSHSYLENLGLCGFPLAKCDAHQNDHKSQLLHEEDVSNLEKGIWLKAVLMGYGCGMLFGIFIGYLVFQCGKPDWIVRIVEGRRAQKIQTCRRSYRHRKRNN